MPMTGIQELHANGNAPLRGVLVALHIESQCLDLTADQVQPSRKLGTGSSNTGSGVFVELAANQLFKLVYRSL